MQTTACSFPSLVGWKTSTAAATAPIKKTDRYTLLHTDPPKVKKNTGNCVWKVGRGANILFLFFIVGLTTLTKKTFFSAQNPCTRAQAGGGPRGRCGETQGGWCERAVGSKKGTLFFFCGGGGCCGWVGGVGGGMRVVFFVCVLVENEDAGPECCCLSPCVGFAGGPWIWSPSTKKT